MPVPVLPSPKSQSYDTIVPSGSKEPDPSNDIAVPSVPEYGPPAFATGGSLTPVTVAVVVLGAESTVPSLTTKVTV